MNQETNISHLNVVTSELWMNGSFDVEWVIESDGLAVGRDDYGRRWEAFWNGERILEARVS